MEQVVRTKPAENLHPTQKNGVPRVLRVPRGYLLFLSLLALPAFAADWVPLTGAGAADQYFYDRSKLIIKDDEITYWKKVVFQQPQSMNGREVVSGLLRERIHCGEHTARLVSYLYYSTAGDTVDYVPNFEGEAAAIIPDTVGDAFERTLCPKVWQKQEEARIKTEQKAAEAELNAARQQAAKPAPPVAKPSATVTPPADPQAPQVAAPTPPAVARPQNAIIQKAPEKGRVVMPSQTPAAGQLPLPQIVPELQMPQLMDQLY